MKALSPREWTFVAVAVLSGLLLWVPDRLPMVDLPQHTAQLAMVLRWGDPSWPFRDLLELNLTTPYLLGYAVLSVVGQALSPLAAMRLVSAGAAVGFALAFMALRREVGGDPLWDWLVLPLGYGFAFKWGLFSFSVGAPLVLLYLVQLRRAREAPTRGQLLGLAATVTGLFFVHILLSAFACALGGTWLLAHARHPREWLRRLLPFAAPVPLALAWAMHTRSSTAYAASPVDWSWSPMRLLEVFGLTLGGDMTLEFVVTGAFLWALPLLVGARPARAWRRWVPLALALALFLFVPDVLMGNHYTVRRFSMFLLPLWLLALEPPDLAVKRPALVGIVLAAVPVLHLAREAQRLDAWEEHLAPVQALTAQMEPGRRVLSLIYEPYSGETEIPDLLHVTQWYAVETGGLVDQSFAALYPEIVRYRPEVLPPLEPYVFHPLLFEWEAHGGWRYDYFLVYSPVEPIDGLFAGASCPVEEVDRAGHWTLLAQEVGEAADPGSCAARRLRAP